MLNSCCLAILLGSVSGLNIGVSTFPSYVSPSTSSSSSSISFFRQVPLLNASIPAGFSTSSTNPVVQSATVGTPPLQVITVYRTVELTVTKLVDYCACPSIAPLPSGQLDGASQTAISAVQATIAQDNNNQASQGSGGTPLIPADTSSGRGTEHEGNGVSDAAAGAKESGPLVNTASTYSVTSTVYKTLPASTFTMTSTNFASSVFVQTLTTRSTTTELQTTVITQTATIAAAMTASETNTAPSSTIQPVYQNTSMSGSASPGSPTLVQPSVSVVILTTSPAASSGSGGAGVDGQGFGEPTSTSSFTNIAFSSTSFGHSEMSSVMSDTIYPASVATDLFTESSSIQESTTTSGSSAYILAATAPEIESTSTQASSEPSSTTFSGLRTFSFSTASSAFDNPLTSPVESESSSTLYTSTIASAGSSLSLIDTTATSTSTTSVDMTSTTDSPIIIISSSSSIAATSLISPVITTKATSSNVASVTTSAALTTLTSSVEYESSSTSDLPTIASSTDSSLSLIDIGASSTSTISMDMTSMTDSFMIIISSSSAAAATSLTSSTFESAITTSMTSSDAASATSSTPIVIDLVQNGGFEDEDASGGFTAPWSFTTTRGTVRSSTNNVFQSNSGTHYVSLSGYASQSVALQQTLTGLLPETEYVLQYFYKERVLIGVSECTLSVLLDTVVIDIVPDQSTQQATYTSRSVSVHPTAASQVLQFVLTCRNSGGYVRDYFLDDISFTTTV